MLRGSVARLNIPATLAKLPEYTQMVERDNLFHSDPGTITFAAGQNPIKHVIYVMKENRTYDQILGDLKVGDKPVGDGDPTLTMYGADITPNEHKLALQFGVLDNFYDSGEVSGDGHVWSTAAITSDYNEKTWQIAYRGKERTYDFQGQVAEEYPLDHNQPDVDDPGTGFLWDNLARNHVSYRVYGEFVNALWCTGYHADSTKPGTTPPEQQEECLRKEVKQGALLAPNVGDPHAGPSPWPWAVPLFSGVKPSKAMLRDHFDPLYPDFNTDYPDQLRADEFLNEFAAYVRARDAHEGPEFEMPSFILLYLPDDHTGGTRPNHARPAANVADNDLALGRVVDAVSHSAYWDDTAIFVLEDDAQDGADHVDAHRSTGFVISKYSPGSHSVRVGRTAQRRAPFLHHGEHGSHDGNAARPAAHEPERRLRATHEPAVFRAGRSASLQSRRSEPEEWIDLRDQQARGAGRKSFRKDGFLPPGRRWRDEAEPRALARPEGLSAHAPAKTHSLSRRRRQAPAFSTIRNIE